MPISSPAISLRRALLRRLIAPLSLLALCSGMVAFALAVQYTERIVDRSLTEFANAIAQQFGEPNTAPLITVPQLGDAMFSDPEDHLIYRVTDGTHEIAGQANLPLAGTSMRTTRRAAIFEADFEGGTIRVAQIRVRRADGSVVTVEVGQRLARLYLLGAEFLVAVMTPLLLLLVAGWLIVLRAVNRQLKPLTQLADSLNRQTHRSLEPVDESLVPTEIQPLTGALNALLTRLKTALDAQRSFIADAAHQLRTPLTALKLHAEQAATARNPQAVTAAVKELRASADRAVRLSNQLLSLARAEPGEQRAQFSRVDLALLAFDTGAESVPRALAHGVDMGFQRHDVAGGQPGSSPLYVRGNAMLLREALANLIDNALKYATPRGDEGGRITLSIGAAQSQAVPPQVELVVEDDGPGVPPEMRPELFKRFFRGDAQTNAASGAGLGLAIVRDIAVLHGGDIFYEDAPGGGSRFVIRLPLAA
jgi:signal transduction histidine kinase